MNQRFASHELLELHEFLEHEAVSATKGDLYLKSSEDVDLRNFISKCAHTKQRRIQACQSLIGQGNAQHSGQYTGYRTTQEAWPTGQHSAHYTGEHTRYSTSFGGNNTGYGTTVNAGQQTGHDFGHTGANPGRGTTWDAGRTEAHGGSWHAAHHTDLGKTGQGEHYKH